MAKVSDAKMASLEVKGVNDLERNSSGSNQEGTTSVLSTPVDNAGYDRSLTKRQIMMMTFGAGVGTGLWVGTGTALKYGVYQS
jgi:amino acid transporter